MHTDRFWSDHRIFKVKPNTRSGASFDRNRVVCHDADDISISLQDAEGRQKANLKAKNCYSETRNSSMSLLSSGLDDSWSFKGATRLETSYLTHGYHRYPAKFIPQLAARLIR